MKQLIACLALVLLVGGANAQGLKAPPVCVDDRLTVLEDRVAKLEKLLKQAEAAPVAPVATSAPVLQTPQTAQGTVVTYSYNASGSYTQPTYSPGRPTTYFPRILSVGEGAPVCGPNGCSTPIRIRR